MSEPIDEYTASVLGKYDGKFELVDISKDGLKLEGEDEEKLKNFKDEFQPLCEYLTSVLSDKVSKVEVSSRLTKSPAALVSSTYGYSANMERIIKAQALKDKRYIGNLGGKRVLEINPRHPIIKKLLEEVNNDETNEKSEDVANVLYDSAILNSGYALEKPRDLTERVLKIVSLNLNIDPDAEVEEEIFPEEQAEENDNIGENDHEEL
jgi:HSP90 family molecular chaperone